MALVTTGEQRGSERGIVLYDPRQRRRALRAARWHSFFVRSFRLLLPVAAVLLMASYGISLQTSTKISDDTNKGTFSVSSIDLLATKPTMRNPTYRGFNQKDGSEYMVTAARAITDLDETKPIDLFAIDATLKQKNGTAFGLKASEGKFDRQTNKLDLFKDIVVRTSDGMAARLTQATILTKEGLITSSKPVAVRFSAGTLTGNSMMVHQKRREVQLAGNVIANLKPAQAAQRPAGTAAAAPKPAARPGIAGLSGGSDEPVRVEAPRLLVKDAQNTARFDGGVRATQGDAELTSATLDIDYAGDTAPGAQTSVKKLTASDNVVINRNTDRIVTKLAIFDVQRDTAELSGGVVITSGADRRIMSDQAFVDSARDFIRLQGQVIAQQGDNVLRGTQLEIDQKKGKLALTDPARKNGRIKARFTSRDAAKGDAGAAEKPQTTTATLPGGSFQTRPGAPIDIEATRLDVDDGKSVAVFRGDVAAAQGDFIVKTDLLEATYTGSAGMNLGAPQTRQTSANGAAPSLKSIAAPGRITVESPGGQYAAGDSGRFDLEKNEIILNGNVVLKRGRQLIRGENLIIDLTSGLSRIETGGAAAWGSETVGRDGKVVAGQGRTMEPAGITNTKNRQACGGRMCAMFFPGDLKKGNPAAGANKSATPATNDASGAARRTNAIGSSWSASTTPNKR